MLDMAVPPLAHLHRMQLPAERVGHDAHAHSRHYPSPPASPVPEYNRGSHHYPHPPARFLSITGACIITPPSSPVPERSEERRVGKECRSRWSPYH